MARITLTVCCCLASAGVGCWGDVVSIYPDGGTDTGTGSGPVEPEFIPGGGVGGGPITGRINLYFFDEATGNGIQGASVMLGSDPETALLGETDVDGLVVFEATDLAGPVDLHVWAEGYSIESYYGLGATNATLAVRPLDFQSASPAPATLTGTVTGFDEIPDPGADEYKVFAVLFGPPVGAALDDRDPVLERAVETEVVPVEETSHTFSIQVPPGPGMLYALGGLRIVTDETEEQYQWTHLGLVTGVESEPGEVISDLEITLNTPLFIEMGVSVGVIPAPYDVKDSAVALSLGNEGTIWFLGRVDDSDTWYNVPDLVGDLASGRVLVVGLADQEIDTDDDLLSLTPRGRRYEQTLSDFTGYALEPYFFSSLPLSVAQLAWDGTNFSCFPPSGTNLATIVLLGAEDGVQAWRATVFGELPATVSAPPPPVSWNGPWIPETYVLIRAWTVVLDADIDDFNFDDFPLLVRDTAENAVLIE